MKIIEDNAVYVQKIDLEFIKYRLRLLPKSISLKTFDSSELDMDDYSDYDFFKFEDPEDIEFFRSIDWIIDYTPLKDLSYTDITPIGRSYVERIEEVTERLYNMSSKDKEYSDTLLQYTILDYQISSLNDISDYKMGLLKFRLPNEGNGVKQLIKKIFSKKN